MAHNIAQINGRAAIAIRAGRPAWHGLGTPLAGNETADEAARKAGADWGLISQRIVINGEPLDYKVVMRDVDQKPLGVVKLGYHEVPPIHCLRSVEGVVKGGHAEWDAIAVLYGGRKFFGSLRLGCVSIAGDDFVRYLVVAGSCDGSLGITFRASATRVVCANTLASMIRANEGAAKIVHRGDAAQRVTDVGAVFARALDAFEGQAAKLELLRKKAISFEQFRTIVESVYRVKRVRSAPVSPLLDDILQGGLGGHGGITSMLLAESEERAKEEQSRTVEILSEIYESAPGAVPGTAYGALQALTYYDTHGRGRSPESRVEQTLLGEDRVDQVLRLVGP